jgi:transposase-like protein
VSSWATLWIEGRMSTGSAKDELVKVATRLIVEETLEGEVGDAIERSYHERRAQPGNGYRNGYRRQSRLMNHCKECTSPISQQV